MVTQNFGWRSWGLRKQLFVSNLLPFVSDIYLWWHSILAGGPEACPKGFQYWSSTFSTYLWATCCHLWAIVTYGDTAFWLKVLRLAKGLPILECHFQQLFVSNLLPFVSDSYLWWHSILAGGPEACQRAPSIGVSLSATICEQLAAICEQSLPMVTHKFGWRSWGFPILVCHFQQLFVNNFLPFVSDFYL
jgi:hypothetical protein